MTKALFVCSVCDTWVICFAIYVCDQESILFIVVLFCDKWFTCFYVSVSDKGVMCFAIKVCDPEFNYLLFNCVTKGSFVFMF